MHANFVAVQTNMSANRQGGENNWAEPEAAIIIT